jgi:Nif-specific regulatory protein
MLSTIDVQKFNTLIEINGIIVSGFTDVHALLARIVESAARLCGGESASLLLENPEHKELYFEAAVGFKGMDVNTYTVPMGEGIVGWAAVHNKPVMIADMENDKRYPRSILKTIGYPARTMLAVPLRSKNHGIGVIALLNKKNGAFTQDDLEWLEIFANQAVLALLTGENAQGSIPLARETPGPGAEYHTLVAKSPVILEKLAVIDQIAKSDSSVLILGESGVGKELFAEQIHLRGNRSGEPFVRVNCAAIPEALLESELFGHVKGAFTSASQTRRGRFEMAAGGTIFLDEIGDMPLSLQAKLLRVIQEKTFEKVGSDVSVTVDVRILAATNKDIEALVARGEFRSDLYYRLNVLPLCIPPLRARPEDIPELAAFFLEKVSAKSNKHFGGFSTGAMDAMLSYSWPGNVRELENCVERACAVCSGETIQMKDLSLNSGNSPELGGRDLKTAINVFKTHFIRKVLEEHHGNQTEAARTLDIQRTYLSRLIKELEISNPKEIHHG